MSIFEPDYTIYIGFVSQTHTNRSPLQPFPCSALAVHNPLTLAAHQPAPPPARPPQPPAARGTPASQVAAPGPAASTRT